MAPAAVVSPSILSADFANLALERRLEATEGGLEEKGHQLMQVLQAANLDPAELGAVTERLDEMLRVRNELIRSLSFDCARVRKQVRRRSRPLLATRYSLQLYSLLATRYSCTRY